MGYINKSQAGNIFFALFGAVAFVGVLGAATMSFMKGPLKTSVTLSRMSVASTQMQVATQMAVLQASSESDSGDCDADGFVEPMEYLFNATVADVPLGGGNIPNSIGATKTDPWGNLYGYCVWNSGSNTTVGGTAACDDDADTNERRLSGSPFNYDIVLAVISAGADRSFATTCRAFATADVSANGVLGDPTDLALVSKTSGSDDVILAYTYAEAATVGGGGLWSIKSSDPGTAVIDKAIEFTGGLTMGSEVDVTVCSASTANVMRYNTFSSGIQVCDGVSTWEDLSGGGVAGNDTEIQFNAAGSAAADTGLTYNATDNALTVDGSVTLGATTGASLPVLVSVPSLALWSGSSGSDIYYDSANVGIGTNTSDTPLHVAGGDADGEFVSTLEINNYRGEYLRGKNAAGNTSVSLESWNNYPNLALYDTGGTARVLFHTYNNSGAYIYSNAAGSRDDGASGYGSNIFLRSPQNSTDTGNGIFFNDSVVSAVPAAGLTWFDSNGSAFGQGGLKFKTNNGGGIATRMTIDQNGNVGIGNIIPDVELDVTGDIEYSGTLTDVSDIRLKDNVVDLDSSLAKVTALKGISFTMKDDETDRVEFGFSAQDVQKVYPELIKTAEDEMGSLSMNYVGLIAPLVESVKELKVENDALNARVMTLESASPAHKGNDQEKWIYLLIGIIVGHCLFYILRSKCLSKEEG